MNVIIVLGSPNDDEGKLLPIAISRCEKAFEVFQSHQQNKILCTGGIGEHFNKTTRPHAKYLIEYLKKKGVPDNAFLPIVNSTYTIEDAQLSATILIQKKVNRVFLVTSEFHMRRAQMIFSRVFPTINLIVAKAENKATESELSLLLAHEIEAYDRDLMYMDKHFPQ